MKRARIHYSVTQLSAWSGLALALVSSCLANLDSNQIILARSYANQFSSEGNDVQAKGMISEALPSGTSTEDIYNWYLEAGFELLAHGDPAAEKLFLAAADASGRPLPTCPEASYSAAFMAQRRGDKAAAERILKGLIGSNGKPSESAASPYALLYEIAEKQLTSLAHEEDAYKELRLLAAGACCENALKLARARYEKDHDAAAFAKALDLTMPPLRKWWEQSNGNHMDAAKVAYDDLIAFCKEANLPAPPALDTEPAAIAETPKTEDPAKSESNQAAAEELSLPASDNFGGSIAPGYLSATTHGLAAASAEALVRGDSASARKFEALFDSPTLSAYTRSSLCVLRGLFLARQEAWDLAKKDWNHALQIEPGSVPALAALAYAEARTTDSHEIPRPAYRAAFKASGKQGVMQEDGDYFSNPAPGRRLLAAAAITNGTAKLSGSNMRDLIDQEISRPLDGNVEELEFALLTAYAAAIDRGEGSLFGQKDIDSILRFSEDLLRHIQGTPRAVAAKSLAKQLRETFVTQKDASTWVAYARSPGAATIPGAEAAWKRLHEEDTFWPGASLPIPVEPLPEGDIYRKLKDLLAGPPPVANDENVRNFEGLWWEEWQKISDTPVLEQDVKTKVAPLFRTQALLQHLQLAALPADTADHRKTYARYVRFLTLAACCDETPPGVLVKRIAKGLYKIIDYWGFETSSSKLDPWLKRRPFTTELDKEAFDDLAMLTAVTESCGPFSPLERACLADKLLRRLSRIRIGDPEAWQILSKYLSALANGPQQQVSYLQALRDGNRLANGASLVEAGDELLSSPLGEFCSTFDTWLESSAATASAPVPSFEIAKEPSVVLRTALVQFLGSGPNAAESLNHLPSAAASNGAAAFVFADSTVFRWMEYGVAKKLADFRKGPKTAEDINAITSWLDQLNEVGGKSISVSRRQAIVSLVKRARTEILIQSGNWTKLATAPR